jgi:hypothetical protein
MEASPVGSIGRQSSKLSSANEPTCVAGTVKISPPDSLPPCPPRIPPIPYCSILWIRLSSDGTALGEREASRLPPIDLLTALLRREKRARHRDSRLVPSEPSASVIFWKLRDRSLHLPTNSPRIDRILGKT